MSLGLALGAVSEHGTSLHEPTTTLCPIPPQTVASRSRNSSSHLRMARLTHSGDWPAGRILAVSRRFPSSSVRCWRDHRAHIEGFERFYSRLLGRPETSYPDRARNKPNVTEALTAILRATTGGLEPRLRRMTWGVWLTTDNNPFIASDSPVAVSLPIEGSSVEDLDHPGFELSMPLSRRAALDIFRPNSGPRIEVHTAVPEAVCEMNKRTARRAGSFLIASSKSFPGVEDLTG